MPLNLYVYLVDGVNVSAKTMVEHMGAPLLISVACLVSKIELLTI